MKPLSLPKLSCKYGAPMGRKTTLPDDRTALIKLRLVRLRFVDSCYDQGGAYWGMGAPIYWATDGNTGEDYTTDVFVRARSRSEAKRLVRDRIPNARFYR